MTRRTTTALAFCLLLALGAIGCGATVDSMKYAAKANGDKYYEFVKLGKYGDAYRNTFANTYKGQLPLDTYEAYQRRFNEQYGLLENYSVVESIYDEQTDTVTLTYSLDLAKLPTPVTEVIRLGKQGTEWRIVSVEPKLERQTEAPAAPH